MHGIDNEDATFSFLELERTISFHVYAIVSFVNIVRELLLKINIYNGDCLYFTLSFLGWLSNGEHFKQEKKRIVQRVF